MRNLKRALSLTLASVMLLGMMVVGTSAKGYSDVDEDDNVEAIEVLQAVEVMVGDDRGFGPDRPVTRNEMAVVMGKLLNLDYNYYTSTCPFTDVADWARGWVGACYANGIVSGRGDGIYDGEATVTAVEAASMMMRALGYFKYESDYADGFVLSTVRQASKIGLFNDVNADTDTPMTRNQVAQLALNTLESTIVDAKKTSADITVGSGDTAVNISGAVEYIVRTGSINSKMTTAIKSNTNTGGAGTDGTTGQTIELGEQLYQGDLVRRETAAETDAFGAPAVRWSYKNTEIGKYAKEADLTYTKEVKIKDIYKDLGLSDEPTSTTYKEDGDTKATANDGMTTLTGQNLTDKTSGGKIGDAKIGAKGSVTNVYYSESGSNRTAIVVITNYYLAKADADYDADDKEVDLTIYNDDPSSLTVKDEDVPVSGVKKGDYLVVTIAEGEVITAVPAEVVSDVEVTSARDKDYVVAGQKYEYNGVSKESGAALGDEYITDSDEYSLIDSTYNLYLDPYGYVLGVEAVEENANVSDYLIITNSSREVGYDLVAKAMFTDGTEETITISKIGGNDAAKGSNDVTANKFYTFKEKSNGKYELTLVPTTGTNKATQCASGVNGGIDSKARPVTGVNYPGTNSTVFIADGKVFTGVKNAPKVNTTSAGIFYVLDKDNRLLIVWTAAKGKVQTSSDDLVYILDAAIEGIRKDDKDGDTYYLYKAFYQGKKVDDFAVNSRDIEDRGLYEIDSYTDDRADLSRGGLISKKAATDNTYVYGKGITGISAKDNVLSVDGTAADGDYMLTDDAKIYTVDDDTVKAVSAGNLSTERTITKDGFDTITIVRGENDADADVILVFLSKASESPNGEISKGDAVDNPTADDLTDAIGDGDDGTGNGVEVEVSGTVPGGTFGGSGSKLPTLNFDDAEINSDTTINGDATVAGTTTIGKNGSLTTLAIAMKTGGVLVVEAGGELSCIDINAYDGNKIVWGDTEYTFSAPLYFHVKQSAGVDKGKIEITDTNTGTKVTTTSTTGNWKDALELAVTNNWASKPA